MRNIITFSGGKDSEAVAIWGINQLLKFELVFCDTKWESPETYQFLDYFQDKANIPIRKLMSKEYDGLIDLANKKKRFPSTRARYCTSKLKVEPMIDFILDEIKEDCIIYQGIRHQESMNRSSMLSNDDFFRYYFEPYGYDKANKPKFYTYRKKDVIKHLDLYNVDVKRPIITWSTPRVFKFIIDNGYKYNPLYDSGYNRVGCFPCVMCSHGEILNMIRERPDKINEIEAHEKRLDSTFFPPKYIPERFCTKSVKNKDGKIVKVPTISDVKNYLIQRRGSADLFSESTCKNAFVQCE